jgi:hypothetical protein
MDGRHSSVCSSAFRRAFSGPQYHRLCWRLETSRLKAERQTACAGGWKRPDFDDSGWSAVRRLDNRHSARGWHGWRLVPSSPIDPRYVADSVHDVFPLLSAGLGERYLETLAPWRDMLTMGLTTFAERPEPTRSDCHAWSSGANSCGVARARCCSPARRRLPSSAAPAGRERSLY